MCAVHVWNILLSHWGVCHTLSAYLWNIGVCDSFLAGRLVSITRIAQHGTKKHIATLPDCNVMLEVKILTRRSRPLG